MHFENEDIECILENPKYTKKGRKSSFGGFTKESFLSLYHALCTCTSCIKQMLTENTFKYVFQVKKITTLSKEHCPSFDI